MDYLHIPHNLKCIQHARSIMPSWHHSPSHGSGGHDTCLFRRTWAVHRYYSPPPWMNCSEPSWRRPEISCAFCQNLAKKTELGRFCQNLAILRTTVHACTQPASDGGRAGARGGLPSHHQSAIRTTSSLPLHSLFSTGQQWTATWWCCRKKIARDVPRLQDRARAEGVRRDVFVIIIPARSPP